MKRFLLAEEVKLSEIVPGMKKQYGKSCMSQGNVYKCIQAFKEGRKSITDEPRPGRPAETKTPELKQMAENIILSQKGYYR